MRNRGTLEETVWADQKIREFEAEERLKKDLERNRRIKREGCRRSVLHLWRVTRRRRVGENLEKEGSETKEIKAWNPRKGGAQRDVHAD